MKNEFNSDAESSMNYLDSHDFEDETISEEENVVSEMETATGNDSEDSKDSGSSVADLNMILSRIPSSDNEIVKMYFDLYKRLALENCGNGLRYSQQELVQLMADFHSDNPIRHDDANLKLVAASVPIITKFCEQSYHTYFEKCPADLLQEGFAAVSACISSYNPMSGAYTTFLQPYVNHAIQEYINSNFNNTTSHYSANILKLKRIINDKAKRNVAWTAEDLSIETDIPITTVKQCLAIIQRNSTERSIDDADNMVAIKLASRKPGPEEIVVDNVEEEELAKKLRSVLTNDEFGVFVHTSGLFGNESLSNAQVSKLMDIPEQEIKGLKATAQQKLERALKNSHLFGKPFVKKHSSPVRRPVQNITFLKSKESLQTALNSFDLGALSF